jgi:hypothetical protein
MASIQDILSGLPNFFGSTPEAYRGLLTPEQSAGLEKRANIGGLLGFAGALAQGMSPQGYRRSALQNILSAAGAGFGAAGQTYESGIGQLSNLQKLQQSQAQIEAINQFAKEFANDPAMMAYLRASPNEAIKYMVETRQFQRAREAAMPTTPATPVPAPAPAPAIDAMGVRPEALPPFSGAPEVYRVPMPNEEPPAPKPAAPAPVARNPEIARLDTQIQQGLADASVYSNLRRPQDAEATLRNVERLRERQQQLIASEIDLDQRIANAPANYKDQYVTLKSIKETLKPKDFIDTLQKIDTAVVESGKQFKFDGIAGNFAYRMFGTNDMTKMTPAQMDLVLRYQNAPTQADQTNIAIQARKLLEETGAAVPVPVARESMIGNVPPAVPPAAPPVVTTTAPVATTTRVAPRPEPAVKAEAKQIVKEVNAPVVDVKVTPLIKKADSVVTPEAKKKLLLAQPSTVALSNYALKNVVDARDAAQKLLDNPAYIDSLTGMTSPLMVKVPDTDAFTANQLMQNLLGRAFVNELSQMRNASPTGGAVGNVAVAEMDSLSKIQSSLVVGMKKDELIKQLKQYVNVSNRAIKTIPNEYARTYGYNGEFDDLLQGTVIERPEAPALPQGVTVKRVR